MTLDHGGHLTHGMHLNFSGKLYKVVAYRVAARTTGSTSTRSRASPRSTSRS